MKHMRKVFALALTLIMALALTVPAFAAPTEDGKITIENATVDQTYTIYRIFDLQSFDGDGHYAYTVNSAWADFINQSTIKGKYVNIDINNGVTWVTGADAQAFAKLALEYANATATKIDSVDSKTADATSVVFENLPLGYYLIDSSLGALCTLNTTDKVITVKDKNSKPTLAKAVQEDSNDQWGTTATADMGQSVNFKLTVGVGSEVVTGLGTGIDADYVITDTLPAGMTYNDDIAITDWTKDADYTANYENDVLTITLKAEKLATLAQASTFDITYSATLDTDAVVGGDGNKNEATLSYNGYTTTKVEATVYTYSFDLVKTDSANEVLNGAEFKLYGSKVENNKYVIDESKEITVALDSTLNAYRIVTTNATVISAGNVKVTGLDAGTYFLKETKAPEGYNPVAAPIEVVITDANLTATVAKAGDVKTPADVENGAEEVLYTANTWVNGGIQVINLTGAELPSTGGIGTTIFYMVGAILMAGAAILLITKKKMSNEQ